MGKRNILQDFLRWSKDKDQQQRELFRFAEEEKKILDSPNFDDEPTWPRLTALNPDVPICENCGVIHNSFCPYEVHGGEG